MDIDQFAHAIRDPSFTPNQVQKSNMVVWANRIYTEFSTLQEGFKQGLVDALMAGAETEDVFKQTLICSLAYKVTAMDKYPVQAANLALLRTNDIEDRVGNLNAAIGASFHKDPVAKVFAEVFNRQAQRRYWDKLIEDVAKALNAANTPIKPDFEASKRAVILTQQFLQPPHAPTTDACEYARFLTDEFGYAVKIVSSKEFTGAPTGGLLPAYFGNSRAPLDTAAQIEYQGKQYPYFQPAGNRFDLPSIQATIASIESFDPSLILTIGGRSVVGEMLHGRANVIAYPTTRGVPLTRHCHFFMWNEPAEEELATMQAEGIADHFLFHSHPGFEVTAAATHFSRSQFGIPQDGFVFAVVGTRLGNDVSADFLAMLGALVAAEPRAFIAFIGNFEGYAAKIAPEPRLSGRCHYLGFHDDMMGIFGICDAYLNPPRTGGGSAIVYAMAADLPALSLNEGDAQEAVRDQPDIADLDQMRTVALSLVRDKAVRAEYTAMARRDAKRLTSRRPLVEKIVAAHDRLSAARSSA